MKKISAVILTLAMMLCLGAAVPFPSPSPENTEGLSGEVIGEVPVMGTALTSLNATYSVTVEWDDLSYAYEFTSLWEWSPSTHTYTGTADGEWDNNEDKTITITNNSSGGITATASVVLDSEAGIKYEITNGETYWESEDATMNINGGGEDNIGEFTLTMTGNPPLSYFISEEWDPLSGEPATKVFGVFTITLVSRNL